MIDGTVTKSTSETRVFASPALKPGNDFTYTLKAEIIRDGRTVTTTKQVIVREGKRLRFSLSFPRSILPKSNTAGRGWIRLEPRASTDDVRYDNLIPTTPGHGEDQWVLPSFFLTPGSSGMSNPHCDAPAGCL